LAYILLFCLLRFFFLDFRFPVYPNPKKCLVIDSFLGFPFPIIIPYSRQSTLLPLSYSIGKPSLTPPLRGPSNRVTGSDSFNEFLPPHNSSIARRVLRFSGASSMTWHVNFGFLLLFSLSLVLPHLFYFISKHLDPEVIRSRPGFHVLGVLSFFHVARAFFFGSFPVPTFVGSRAALFKLASGRMCFRRVFPSSQFFPTLNYITFFHFTF